MRHFALYFKKFWKAGFSVMAVAYIPDVEHGEQIYNEIDRVNGRNVDYNNIGLIIPYTWNDFTDLVQYEREQKISPYYSAMIATNLMKNKFRQKFIHFKDITCVSEPEALSIFWTNNYIMILNKIPTWDIETGNYFDKYYELFINDAARTTAEEINCTINIPTISTVEVNNQKKQVVSRTAAISLSNGDIKNDEEYSLQDKLVFSALTAACAEESINIDSYNSPELIYEKRAEIELSNNDGFYNSLEKIDRQLEDKNNKLVINKQLASTFVFMEKFMDGDIKEDILLNEKIAPVLNRVFSTAVVQKEQKVKEQDKSTENDIDTSYEDEYEM